MPSSISVAPALGHALCDSQGFAPSGYDAIDMRRVRSIGLQAGVLDAASYKVTAAATPLQLTVDADGGDGLLVRGVNVSAQGLYYVAPHAANMTLDVTPGDATNPRVDQVIAEVLDAEHDGGASNDVVIRVVPGTPTAGATLDSRSGADPLTGLNCTRLADVLVPAGLTGVIPGANVRDRRPWARGALATDILDVTFETTSGASSGAVITGLGPIDLECSGVLVEVHLELYSRNATAGAVVNYDLYLDGSKVSSLGQQYPVASRTQEFSGSWFIEPTPGHHTFEFRTWNDNSGDISIYSPSRVTISEDLRVPASN